MIQIKYSKVGKKLLKKGIDCLPKKANAFDVGYDMFCALENDCYLLPGEVKKIPSGVHIFIGKWVGYSNYYNEYRYSNYYNEYELFREIISKTIIQGQCVPRSSIHPGLTLVNAVGTLDPTYQGEWIFKVQNTSEELILIKPGDKLFQMVFIPVVLPEVKIVDEFDEITERGENGFGSTGK